MNFLPRTLLLITTLTLISFLNTRAQQVGPEELRLYKLIMQHRKTKGLQQIPLSSSLTKVAQIHAKDLQENYDWNNSTCNLHSWSSKGKWKPMCYTDDHQQSELMWSKPSELTAYQGAGFEIAFGVMGPEGSKATPEEALKSWKSSPGHYELIINQGDWKDKWIAIGIGIYRQYAVVWFGKEPDPADEEKASKR